MRIALPALLSLAAFAQSGNIPAFEVASVKPADPKSAPTNIRGGPGTSDPGQIAWTNVALSHLLTSAYGMSSDDQIAGPPGLKSDRYDIVAKLPPGTTKEQFHQMLLNLLAERFHMVLHHETRDFQGYELVVGKGGPKLKKSSAADSTLAEEHPGPTVVKDLGNDRFELESPGWTERAIFGAHGHMRLMARAQTLSDLSSMLVLFLRCHLVDKTGLTGRYDFTLDASPDPSASLDTADDSAPYILDAVQEQLGLKLQPVKIPLDTVIVDSVDKTPTEN